MATRIFLLELLLFGLATILFLLYFNRALGFLVSLLVNTYTWTFYRATFRVRAIQLSLLGGRAFFKGICYQGANETILVHDGYITWRYWFRRVCRAEALDPPTSTGPPEKPGGAAEDGTPAPPSAAERPHGKNASPTLPCRMEVKVRGVEWFVYNRSPAYDTILATLVNPVDDEPIAKPGSSAQRADGAERVAKHDEKASPSSTELGNQDESRDTSTGWNSGERDQQRESPSVGSGLPLFLQSFPIRVYGNGAAMVMGNEHTRSVFVAKVRDFDGRLDARRPAGPHDQYRQCFDFSLTQGTVSFKHNHNYSGSHIERGSKLWNNRDNLHLPKDRVSVMRPFWYPFERIIVLFNWLNPFSRRSWTNSRASKPRRSTDSDSSQLFDPLQSRWLGLSRYLVDNADGDLTFERWKAIEYARVETIADVRAMSMSFFWDVAGLANEANLDIDRASPTAKLDHVNGSTAPAYGLEINLGGGTINYGPWADRQRANLQAVFFPSTYSRAKPAARLQPGAYRISTVFEIRIVLDEPVVLRIHTREESKDWRSNDYLNDHHKTSKKKSKRHQSSNDDTEKGTSSSMSRPSGWLDANVAKDSVVVYKMDMLARDNGFRNLLDLDIKSPRISSSVNHDLLCRAENLTMECDLSNPLLWKDLHAWLFGLTTKNLELFLLRDHAFLLQDVVNDWTSGPANDFFEFVPFLYTLKLNMPGTRVYLNVNDSNIINNPSSLDDNAFIVIGTEDLEADLDIPLINYQALQSRVSFDAHAQNMYLELSTPLWTTQRTFLEDKKLADLENLRLTGSYNYCSATSPSLTDTVLLDLEGSSLRLTLFGFLIRYFMNFKENYFGEDLHFQTQEEFQQKLELMAKGQLPIEARKNPRQTNDLDVILTVVAKEASIALPSLLYSAAEHIKVDLPLASLDLRFTNYYMDMQGDFSPLSISKSTISKSGDQLLKEDTSTQLFIDGANITGHRLFGLPPTEPTYVCNWDFDVGSISGEASLNFLSGLVGTVQSFAFGFPDSENSISRLNPLIIRDITFLRARVKPIKFWVHVDHSAFLISTDELEVHFNDKAGDRSSERLMLSIPRLVSCCVDTRSASRSRSQVEHDSDTYAFLETSINVRLIEVKPNFEDERRLQQNHLMISDSRTNRTPWLIREEMDQSAEHVRETQKNRPPAMPYPPMPEPIYSEVNESQSDLSSAFFVKSNPQDIHTPLLGSTEAPEPLAGTRSRRVSSHIPSTSGQRESMFGGLQHPMGMSTSSGYSMPNFPLSTVVPNPTGLPTLQPFPEHVSKSEYSRSESLPEPDKQKKSQILIVKLDKGIRALFTPDAVLHVVSLVYGLQGNFAESSLDAIQASTMSQILGNGRPAVPRILEIRFELPCAAIRFLDRAVSLTASSTVSYYNISTRNLTVTLQQRTPERIERPADQWSLHCKLYYLDFNVVSVADAISEQTVLQLGLNNLTAYGSLHDGIWSTLRVEGIDIISLNRNPKLLGTLINQAIRFSQVLSKSVEEKQNSLRRLETSLVFYLATYSRSLPEAPFMTTTSFTLRTAKFNPRNSDSWKLMSRLRWVLQHLTMAEHQRMIEATDLDSVETRSEAKEIAVAALHQWRGWDLTNIGSSILMMKVFGLTPTAPIAAPPKELQRVHCALSIGKFSLAVDPGLKEDSFSFEQLQCVISNSGDATPQSRAMTPCSTLTVATFCKKADVAVRWEMVELIAGLSEEVETPELEHEEDNNAEPPQEYEKSGMPYQLHVVVVFEQFSTRIETINLEYATRCFGLTVSALIGTTPTNPLREAITVYSSHAISELSAQHTSILAFKLQRPSIHLSREGRTEDGPRDIVKAGGFCQNLELHITQDLLGIIGVLDRVLSDEVRFLLASRQVQAPSSTPAQPVEKKVGKKLELHAVLLLESYHLTAKVVSTLQYSIQGINARSACRSLPGAQQMAIIDWDVDAVTHTFTNYDNDKAYQVASLVFPPLNGQVSLVQHESITSVTLVFALQQIVLDASALHALFTTYSRREVSAFRQNVVRDMKLISANFENVMKERTVSDKVPEESNPPSRSFHYRAHFSAAGLKIKARTARASAYSARLTFELGHLIFKIHNFDGEKQLSWPEMTANLQSFGIFLKRFDGSRSYRCGDFSIAGSFVGTSRLNEKDLPTRSYEIATTELSINVYPETASTIVDIIGYLQQRFKSFSLTEELNTLTFRARRLRARSRTFPMAFNTDGLLENDEELATALFSSMYSLEMNHILVAWRVGSDVALSSPTHNVEDLQFSISRVHLSTRRSNAARLTIQDLQLQMAPRSLPRNARSKTSALLPEVVFNVAYLSTANDRRLAFQAVGKMLDLRLTTQSAIPAANLQKSIALATRDLRKVIADWNAAFIKEEEYNKNILGNKSLSSILVVAEFAGAVVHVVGKDHDKSHSSRGRALGALDLNVADGINLQAPGIALKVEYRRPVSADPSLNAEVRIDASSNILHPAVVPLFYEISDSIKHILSERGKDNKEPSEAVSKQLESDPFASADPSAILGSTRLNLGLRIRRQQFGLTCQPLARVAAHAQFDDIYITVNTVQSQEQGRFVALSASVLSLQSSLQHVYSREPTASFSIERISLSLMNSRHVSDVQGISAILKVSPMTLNVNAKQMHDFFLFKEIWLPSDIVSTTAAAQETSKKTSFDVSRYREVTATGAFPWNASTHIEKLDIQLDLGQSLGKSSFSIAKLWVSSKKTSDRDQDLCIGFHQVGINSTGRLSGFVELQKLQLQTSIHWPEEMRSTDRTPLIEASLAVGQLQAKLAFEYQAFLVAELSGFEFLMYNVRDPTNASGDRLVCLVEGDKVQAFCTTQSSAQCVSLFQAVQRLVQEKRTAYANSLKDVEKFLHRKSNPAASVSAPIVQPPVKEDKDEHMIPLQLQTNVVIALKAVKVGAYPRTFFDPQIFKLEALDASTRFSVAVHDGQVQSGLGASLGQVRIALSELTQRVERRAFEEMQVAEVVAYSTGSRGGTILKVPRVLAEMQTWQAAESFHIDYLFKSAFEGKIEVGWNYSRISYLRGMWGSHSRALAQRLGKPLPQSAVQITSGLDPLPADGKTPGRGQEQEKITAVVNVPLSKYDYTALEPAIIVTPQLRDMGEATPPLEWIGLNRERLPNLTHQIVIVPLLEVAKEVEDAYTTILGSS